MRKLHLKATPGARDFCGGLTSEARTIHGGCAVWAQLFATMLFVGPAIEFLPSAACAAPPAKPHVSFSEDVLPLLKFKCSACHLPGGEGYEKSGDKAEHLGLGQEVG